MNKYKIVISKDETYTIYGNSKEDARVRLIEKIFDKSGYKPNVNKFNKY